VLGVDDGSVEGTFVGGSDIDGSFEADGNDEGFTEIVGTKLKEGAEGTKEREGMSVGTMEGLSDGDRVLACSIISLAKALPI
jgi:hypothetical protein